MSGLSTYRRNRERLRRLGQPCHLRITQSCILARGRIDYTAPPRTARSFTADHIVAQARGGTDDLSNLAAACYACNSARGAKKRHDLPVAGTSTTASPAARTQWPAHSDFAGWAKLLGMSLPTFSALRPMQRYEAMKHLPEGVRLPKPSRDW